MAYRRLIPMTHEQYMDEPAETVDWTLHMNRVEAEVRAEAERKAAQRA